MESLFYPLLYPPLYINILVQFCVQKRHIARIIYEFDTQISKVFKVNSKPNFISNISNYTETNQANRARKIFFNGNG